MTAFPRILTLLCLALLLPLSSYANSENPVGRTNRTYVDATRQNWDGSGAGPLDTVVWYPAAAGTPQPERTVDIWRFGHSQLDAEARANGPLPLILLSHGVGGTAAQLTWLAEQLVKDGFIVAAVNHHGNTAVEDRVLAQGVLLPTERALDLSALLDELLADPQLAPLINSASIGAAGFSYGGFTVLATAGMTINYGQWWDFCRSADTDPMCTVPPEADFTMADLESLRQSDAQFAAAMERNSHGARDERVRAVYAIAPALVTMSDLTGLQVPAAGTLAEHDDQVPLEATAGAFSSTEVHVGVVGAAHYTFLAPCTTLGRWFAGAVCADPRGVDREAVHRQVSADISRFFLEQLALSR